MSVFHIAIFTVISVACALVLKRFPSHALRNGLLLMFSVLALFWLQPATAIRNLSFWLPLVSLGLIGVTWATTQPMNTETLRRTLPTLLVVAGVALSLSLLREVSLPREIAFAKPPQAWQVLIGLACVLGLAFAAGRLGNGKPRVFTALLVLLIGAFVLLKFEFVAGLISQSLRWLNTQNISEANARDLNWLGFSYIAFRLIHVIREKQNGKLISMSLQEFVIYCAFFPAVTAGPIDRSDRFVKDLRAPFVLDSAVATDAARRLFIGIFKKFALADTLALVALNELNAAQVQNAWAWGLVFAYALRIYFDFSGYTDIAIGLGRWFGVKLPENFNNPYLKPNLTQFWNNWHMSLSQWFRAYWFNPLTRTLRKSQSAMLNRQSSIVFLGQTSTMFLIALWHGVSLNFVAWGAWHALGLFVHNRWAELAKTRGIAEPRRWSNALGTMVTFVFVALGWVWFALPSVTLSLHVFRRMLGL